MKNKANNPISNNTHTYEDIKKLCDKLKIDSPANNIWISKAKELLSLAIFSLNNKNSKWSLKDLHNELIFENFKKNSSNKMVHGFLMSFPYYSPTNLTQNESFMDNYGFAQMQLTKLLHDVKEIQLCIHNQAYENGFFPIKTHIILNQCPKLLYFLSEKSDVNLNQLVAFIKKSNDLNEKEIKLILKNLSCLSKESIEVISTYSSLNSHQEELEHFVDKLKNIFIKQEKSLLSSYINEDKTKFNIKTRKI